MPSAATPSLPRVELAAFTAEHICRLTGLSNRQFGYWDRGRDLPRLWIEMIEFHYERALEESDIRMMVQIQESGVKFM